MQTASMTDLTSMRDALFDPDRRLFYELAYPLDCARSEIDAYYAALGANLATEDLLGFADRLWPLARANFLAHVASHRPASGGLLYELVRSHTAIDPTDIHVRLRTIRASSGFPAPSFLSINQGLSELRKIHSEAALVGYCTAQDAAVPMLKCTLQALASEEGDCSKALGRLLRSYKHAISQARMDACQRIEGACAALLIDPSDTSFIREIYDAAEAWTSLCRPLLAWNADHPDRQLSFDTPVAPLRRLLRALCDSKQFRAAIEVTAATREIFAAVPTTLDQLAEDARLFAAMSAYRNIEQLQKLVHDADIDASSLIAALETSGFGETSTGPAKILWRAFVNATTAPTSPGPSSWRLVHGFAVRLSNRPKAAAAVVALITGLIRHGERTSQPPKMLGEFRDNLAFMRSFMGAELASDEMPSGTTGLGEAVKDGRAYHPTFQVVWEKCRTSKLVSRQALGKTCGRHWAVGGGRTLRFRVLLWPRSTAILAVRNVGRRYQTSCRITRCANNTVGWHWTTSGVGRGSLLSLPAGATSFHQTMDNGSGGCARLQSVDR